MRGLYQGNIYWIATIGLLLDNRLLRHDTDWIVISNTYPSQLRAYDNENREIRLIRRRFDRIRSQTKVLQLHKHYFGVHAN